MKIIKSFAACLIAATLAVASPAIAQETPEAGSGGNAATWGSMPVGSYVMIGGFIFLVTATGLILADDDDKKASPTPTPTPAPPPGTTTTTTTS